MQLALQLTWALSVTMLVASCGSQKATPRPALDVALEVQPAEAGAGRPHAVTVTLRNQSNEFQNLVWSRAKNGEGLALRLRFPSGSERWIYDPANPTAALGGIQASADATLSKGELAVCEIVLEEHVATLPSGDYELAVVRLPSKTVLATQSFSIVATDNAEDRVSVVDRLVSDYLVATGTVEIGRIQTQLLLLPWVEAYESKRKVLLGSSMTSDEVQSRAWESMLSQRPLETVKLILKVNRLNAYRAIGRFGVDRLPKKVQVLVQPHTERIRLATIVTVGD